jgi:AcrR family transcriptional regulator
MVVNAYGDGGSDSELVARIHAATLRCLARWGVSKTTLEDVAREAGCSRATLYRTIAGGKNALLATTVRREIDRLFRVVDDEVGEAGTLEDVLVAGIGSTTRFIGDHAAFQFLLAHEPDVVLPFLAFDRLETTFRAATGYVQGHLARFLTEADAATGAEWVVRVLMSYLLTPSDSLDLRRDADARHVVRTYLLPGLTRSDIPSPQPSP